MSFCCCCQKERYTKRNPISVSGYLLGEENTKRRLAQEGDYILLSPSVSSATLQTSELNGYRASEWGGQGQTELYTTKSRLGSFASSRGAYKL